MSHFLLWADKAKVWVAGLLDFSDADNSGLFMVIMH
jgi:hypothetical protein